MATINPPVVTAGKSVISVTDVATLVNGPQNAIETVLSNLIGAVKPTTIESLLGALGSERVEQMKGHIKYGSKSYKEASHAEFVEMLKACVALVAYLDANKVTVGPAAAPVAPLVVNQPGLHLLLANPMIAKVVMEQRKKQAAAGLVRAVAVPSGIFGLPVGQGIHISLSGGAMTEAMTELDNNVPIEMRGAGYALAAMRGGSIGGNVIFGTQGTTMWRPIDDNSFISQSLELAIENLKNQISKSGASLDSTTEASIRQAIVDLKKKEEEVKKYRDQITSMNSALAVGSAKASGNVDLSTIERTAEAYNNAMKSRQKIEGKLLRVVVALGGKVAAVNV